MMKGNLESYRDKYEEFISLMEEGKSLSEISRILGVGKSTLHYWKTRGKRETALEKLEKFLREKGPSPLYIVKEKFPKHSELYTKSRARGSKIRKYDSGMKPPLRHWYYLEGQEKELGKRVSEIRKKIEKAKQAIKERLSKE